jgi:hypothetical protein
MDSSDNLFDGQAGIGLDTVPELCGCLSGLHIRGEDNFIQQKDNKLGGWSDNVSHPKLPSDCDADSEINGRGRGRLCEEKEAKKGNAKKSEYLLEGTEMVVGYLASQAKPKPSHNDSDEDFENKTQL